MYQLLDPKTCTSRILVDSGNPTAIVDVEDIALAAVARDGRIVYANRAFFDRFHLHYSSISHMNIRDIKEFAQLDHHFFSPQVDKLIYLYTSKAAPPVGYLFLSFCHPRRRKLLAEITKNPDNPLFFEVYCGLYLADPEAFTLKVNPSYEKIAFLPEGELLGRNLRELEEKGYFSQSVTLRVLAELHRNNSVSSITLFQKIVTGKEVIVTGKPVFSEGKLHHIITFVRDLIPLDTITSKCETLMENRGYFWGGTSFIDSRVSGSVSQQEKLPLIDRLPIVAKSPKSLAVLRKVVSASLYDTPVLLTGETGVGKDLIAKYIHMLSSQTRPRPFVTVNCSAIPQDLLESELFGYEEGAFSGARRGGKKGLFEQADGGILFLNEISEMPLELQAKLLTALDEGVIRRLGGTRTKRVKARIICATNSDLRKKVEERSFRSDLYYRIKVLAIHIPPLRERREDILPLLRYFTEKICRKYNMRKYLSPAVLEVLQNYSWPGNVRELRNLIEQLVIFSPTSQISVGDLPEEILQNNDRDPFKDKPDLPEGVTLKSAVKSYEQRIIRSALQKYGNLTSAARALGVDPTTLSRKLRR